MLREFEKITSISNPKIKFIKSLLLRKNRSNLGYFLAEGERICKEAIDHDWSPKYLIYNNERDTSENIDSIIAKCIQEGGLILNVSQKILSKISKKENPQIILGVFQQKLYKINEVRDKKSLAWLVLERVRDPGNLGTILRTCNATGVTSIILVGNCCDPFSPESVRASMGAIFSIKIINLTKDQFLLWAANKNNKIVTTNLNAKKYYTECNWGPMPIIIMGNEQSGISKELEKISHESIKLPMLGTSDSLNLSVSTGVFLYDILRKKIT